MSIATQEGPARMVFEGIRWATYEALAEDLGGRRLRLTYDRGMLEIMSPRLDHERYKTLLGRMVEALTDELEIPVASSGSTTWKSIVAEKGLEYDESYYVQNEARMRGKTEFDPAVDPPPDLAIEVEITKSALDRMAIYSTLGVPEVWRYDRKRLRVAVLGEKGRYLSSDVSVAFPFLRPAELARFLANFGETDETTWIRDFRQWVRDHLAKKLARRRRPR